MHRILAIAAFAVVAALGAGCTSSGSVAPSASSPAPTGVVSTATSSRPNPSTTAPSTTPPAVPTVPADVPTTGPNLRTKDERPPVMPVEATKHTTAGAQAFARFFLQTIDWGYATTSSTYMRHYFETTCVACLSAADAVDNARNAGHHFIGDRFTIRSAAGQTDPAVVLVTFDIDSVEVVDVQNKYVDATAAIPSFKEKVSLRWRSSGWTVHVMEPSS